MGEIQTKNGLLISPIKAMDFSGLLLFNMFIEAVLTIEGLEVNKKVFCRVCVLTAMLAVPSVSLAGFFDDLVNNIGDAAKNRITEEVGSITEGANLEAVKNGVSTLLPGGNVPPSDIDILGIKMGMSQDQLSTALKKVNAAVEIEEIVETVPHHNQKETYLSGLAATIDKNNTMKAFFSAPTKEQEVIHITKVSTYQKNGPYAEKTVESLISKYGKPSRDSGSRARTRTLSWMYDRFGGFITSPDKKYKNNCTNIQGQPVPHTERKKNAFSICGLNLHVILESKNGIVTSMIMTAGSIPASVKLHSDLNTYNKNEKSASQNTSVPMF